MQTLNELRELFDAEGIRPRKRFGQNFLIDRNLMDKLLELAELTGNESVLEIGPATGSLTEELLARAARVIACEIDRGLADILARRLGDHPKLTILRTDALAGKHALAAEVLAAATPTAHLVSNLPYKVAVPIIAECLASSWRAVHGDAGAPRFERLTFTVQKEVADRLTAGAGSGDYGPVSVLVALLGKATSGPVLPASAFWPKPKVASRIVRIDFDAEAASRIDDLAVLRGIVQLSFGQRRKKLGTILRRQASGPALLAAAGEADLDLDARAERIEPRQFAAMAAALGRGNLQ